MGRLVLLLSPVLALVSLAGCGSGDKATVPSTTTTASSSIPVSTTTTTELSSTTSAAPAATSTTTSTVVRSSVQISEFTVSPASPVCNAPTMIQLQWTTVGASSVDLSIDGKPFATFGGGAQSHLEYYACDGKPHSYVLTARAGSATATANRVVTSTTG
ncbi:MAG: hypothetical protein QOH28_2384 [Actinomycetota bacterium]|jgi:hypothetical protein|nr:hypothetical protein [Actinomycetota bacterium]